MLSFPVLVLGLLFVSFRPTLLRSRSRSTGDPLSNLFSGAGACLPLPFGRFGLLLTTQPSVFLFPSSRSPLTAVPSVRDRSFRPCRSPLTSGSSPSHLPDSGTQLPAISFLRSLFRVTGTTQPPASCFQLGRPLSFHLRFGLLGFVVSGFGSPQRPDTY